MASINALCASTHILIPTTLTPMSESGAVTFSQFLEEFSNVLCPKLKILAALPTMTKGTLDQSEIKTIENLAKKMPVWIEHSIPRRQAIADNRLNKDAFVRDLFDRLAEKVITTLGLHPDGPDEGRRTYRGAPIGGYRLSQ
jgi:cellulose biosynthesis protein BcsQ